MQDQRRRKNERGKRQFSKVRNKITFIFILIS